MVFKLSNIIYYVLLKLDSSKEGMIVRSHQQQSNCRLTHIHEILQLKLTIQSYWYCNIVTRIIKMSM